MSPMVSIFMSLGMNRNQAAWHILTIDRLAT